PFMTPRYPGAPRPGVRMPQMPNDFNGPPGDGDFVGWQGMNPRMGGPRGPAMGPGPGMGPMGPGAYGPGMRGPPPSSIGPGGPAGPGIPPISMSGASARQPWTPNTSTPMSYSSSSPGTYGNMMVSSFPAQGPPGSCPPGPGTPIMPSPHHTGSGGTDGMLSLMNPVPGGPMPGEFPMSGGGGSDGSGGMGGGPGGLGGP
ncbi:hypothetical protein FHG87_025373, partial [Trinorchestia longiramus]